MSGFQGLKDLFRRRMDAAVKTDMPRQTSTSGYEEELHRQRQQLGVNIKPDMERHTADVQQVFVGKAGLSPLQEKNPHLDEEDTESPYIKKEQEELWSSQGGEQNQWLEGADTTKFMFTTVIVKGEDNVEEKFQSSQLHKRQTEEVETEAGAEDHGRPAPALKLDPERLLQLETEVKTEDASDPDTDDSDDWREAEVHHTGLKSVDNLEDKRPENAKKSHSCSQCGRTFKIKQNLKRHMRVHTGEKPYICQKCGKRFSWDNQLKRHKCIQGQTSELHQNQRVERREAQSRTDGGEPEPARTSSPERHSQHETENGGDGEKTTGHQLDLNSEESSKNERSNKSNTCFFCCKAFKKKWDLTQHMKNHTGEKPFSCSECGKKFGQKHHLIGHKRVHTGEKPFSCSECGQRFTRNSTLTCHMAIHRGEKPFGCSVCGKKFNQRGHLITHMLVHSGEKPFGCSECDKRFTHKYYLTLHMARHKGEKPISCSVCEQNFSWYSQLKNHKCFGGQTSEFYQNQMFEETTETGADVEDCGGPGLARNSDQERHLQLETEIKTENLSEPETEISNDWKEIREHQSGFDFMTNYDLFQRAATFNSERKQISDPESDETTHNNHLLKIYTNSYVG
ncbi:zinc finger protein 436-like [Xyrichtys novacula]|uniref:Zinc finger protein 436-like n=1 Tax=Xyrichtys novacula TaxID=13765 RepID=A0AAV1GUU3_XYRNO|nr:zinc finger protein 436-like [Xyrichtys novacula]